MESDLINWIVEAVVALVLDIVVFALGFLSTEFKVLMRPNATINGSDNTLEFFWSVFIPNVDQGGTTLWSVMIACGIMIAYAILIFQIFKGLFGPLAKAESPMRLIGRTLLTVIGVCAARHICSAIFALATVPYELLLNPIYGITSDVSLGGLGDTALQLVTKFASEYLQTMTLSGLLGKIIQSLLSIFILFSIVVNYFKLMIEIVERYVILGVLSFFSPLCIATAASENTNQIFKSWIKMMISQCILLFMSTFFVSVFEQAIMRAENLTSYNSFIVLLMYLAWLRTGQRIDSHMSTLGLSVAQSGGGLYGDLFAGAALMSAVANPGQTALGKMANTGMGIAQAGGLKAYAMTSDGGKTFGGAASRIARATASDADKIKAAQYEAKANQWGQATGQLAAQGALAKYGNAKASVDEGGPQRSLKDLVDSGHTITSATMTEDGAYLQMDDGHGNSYGVKLSDAQDGSQNMKFDISPNEEGTAAAQSIAGVPDVPDLDGNQLANQTDGQANMAADENPAGSDVELAEGGFAEGGFNQDQLEMTAESVDGEQANVDGQIDQSGQLMAGELVQDENGNNLGLSDGGENAQVGDSAGANFSADAEAQSAVFTEGPTQDIAAGLANGTLKDDGHGNIVDAKTGEIVASQAGAQAIAEGLKNGSLKEDGKGNIVDAKTGAMVAPAGSFNNIAAGLADGSLRQQPNGNIVDAKTGAAVASQNNISNITEGLNNGTLKQDAKGNILDAKTGAMVAPASSLKSGSLAQDASGNWQNVTGSQMKTVGTDAQGHAFDLTGKVDAQGNVTGGIQHRPDGSAFIKDNNGREVNVGADGKVQGMTSIANQSTLGNYGKTADGKTHDISSAFNATGTALDSSKIQTDANGNQFVKASDGAHVPVSNGQVVGGTFNKADGFITSKDGKQVAVSSGIVGSAQKNIASNATTYNPSTTGSMAIGSDHGVHDISNVMTSSGSINPQSIQRDNQGSYITANDGARVPINNVGEVASQRYDVAQGNTGSAIMGYVSDGNGGSHQAMLKTNGDGTVSSYDTRTVAGSMSIQGDTSAISHGYTKSEDNSGGYVKSAKGDSYSALYSGSVGSNGNSFSGTSSEGGAQLYARIDSSSPTYATDLANAQKQGYPQDNSGNYYTPITSQNAGSYSGSDKFAMTDNGSGGYNMTNVGYSDSLSTTGQTYNQHASLGGIALTTDQNGNSAIAFGSGASVKQTSPGVVEFNNGFGATATLSNTKMYDAPSPNAAQVQIGGENYWVQPTSSVASNTAYSGTNGHSNLMSSMDGGLKHAIQTHSSRGTGVYDAAEKVSTEGQKFKPFVQEGSNYRPATQQDLSSGAQLYYQRSTDGNYLRDGKTHITHGGITGVTQHHDSNAFTINTSKTFYKDGKDGTRIPGGTHAFSMYPCSDYQIPPNANQNVKKYNVGGVDHYAIPCIRNHDGDVTPLKGYSVTQKRQQNVGPVLSSVFTRKSRSTSRYQMSKAQKEAMQKGD